MGESSQRSVPVTRFRSGRKPIKPEMRKNDPKARAENILPYRFDRRFDSRELGSAIGEERRSNEGYRFFAPAAALRAAQYFFAVAKTIPPEPREITCFGDPGSIHHGDREEAG